MKTDKRLSYVACAVGIATLAASPAAIAKSRENPARLLDALEQCQSLSNPTQRLACYDQGIRELRSAREQDKELFESRPQQAKFETINANLESVAEVAPGTWLLVLSDHSVWRTDDDVRFIPKTGVAVIVVKASLGSFMATIGKERAVRVIRRR